MNEREALYERWLSGKPSQERGLLVACDANLEWILPWWWDHYTKYNSAPVVFVNFGMSEEAVAWCRERGECLDCKIPLDFVVPKEQIAPELQKLWESNFFLKDFWKVRPLWFQKPFAFMKSPFRQTIWIDLDCEILGDLSSLFETCTNEAGLAIVPEPDYSIEQMISDGTLKPGEKSYNSGVVVYAYGSKLVFSWAQAVVEKNGEFAGDQDVLSDLIRKEHFSICELPQIYNWRTGKGSPPQPLIIHWVSDLGKERIRNEMKRDGQQ